MTKHRKSQRSLSQEFFPHLVNNAVDFLEQAVKDLPDRPKYSAIHFYSAIELFLKARILHEHWSLVVDRPQQADFAAFRNGDFKSVTLEEAASRLKSINGSPLREYERKCFDDLRKDRNRIVHFIPPDHSSKSALEQLVLKQLRAWYYTHRLLTRDWASHFRPFSEKLRLIDDRVRGLSEYVHAKFSALEPEIESETKSGSKFRKCEFCGFVSAKEVSEGDNLYSLHCKMCEPQIVRVRFLRVACTCGGEIEFEDGNGECSKCPERISADDLVSKYAPCLDPKDYPDGGIAHCEECDQEAVIPWGERYLCMNCLTEHATVSNCQCCGDLVSGEAEDSSIIGCFRCHGPRLPD